MNDKPQTTAKDFFLYLSVTIALYVSVASFLALIFAIINKVLPLVGEYSESFDGTIKGCVAALIIFFPSFFYLSWLIFKDLKANPERRVIWVRKWMVYLNLFISGLTIAIDLAILIYRFLGAEDLTLRFFLKVFFVLASAITIFVFYFYNTKRETFEYRKGMNIFLALIASIIFGSCIYGIMLIGSPSSQQARSFDTQRIEDLTRIQNELVYTEWQSKGDIPENLSDLNNPISGFALPTDPKTKQDYEYKKISKNSFELCATFQTKAESNQTVTAQPSFSPQTNLVNENWQHNAGRFCFERTIDEKLYPVAKAVK